LFGDVLSQVNPSLHADELESLLGSHAEHLVSQVDAYRAADYSTAYSVGRDAYKHTQVISDVLATAIAAQFPEIFPPLPPTAGTATGGAPVSLGNWALAAALLVAAGLFTSLSLARRFHRQ
jgi:hypothetical protein